MSKTAALVGLGIIMVGGAAFGQAALPTFWSGPWNESPSPLPIGWSQKGLGADYVNYDNEGAGAARLDGSGDWVQIYFGSQADTVSYYAKINGTFGDSVFTIQESHNGSSWTDVQTFNSTNPVPTAATQYHHDLLAGSRYVRFIYTQKVSGNVGIDGILIDAAGPPSITFEPSGNQSVPVSNLLELAVSITPPGSGMESWILTPTNKWAGEASLSNGLFSMTPAQAAVNWNFTLSVSATNAVGTNTGYTMILVTPYTPPMPVVTFSPAAPYGVEAGKTQRLGVAVSPVGCGLSGEWTLLPSNYQGSATLVGTNFSFATAANDGPATYTLSIMATNEHGIGTGTATIVVSEYVPPPAPGSVIVDFEDAPNKTDYVMVTNTMSGRQWMFSGATSIEAGDKKFGMRAMRIRSTSAQSPIKLGNLSPFTNGIESVSLWFASYGNDGTNGLPQVSIQVSTNLDTGWVTMDTFDTGSATELKYHFVPIKVKGSVYFRLWSPTAPTDNRANIDNIVIEPYVVPTGYEAYLLQYNVTPGDPGTAPEEDWDGDGYSNQAEFTAGTNPYDADHHP